MTSERDPLPDRAAPVSSRPATEAATRAEAAATRRRWINLGEFVAVAGLLIAGTGLWLNWSDRRGDLAERQTEHAAQARQAARYDIAADVAKNGDLLFRGSDRHRIGDVTLTFPAALGIGTRTTPAQAVPLAWYKSALLKATDGGADTQTGTLPVLVRVEYWDGDTQRTAHGIHDIVWRTHGRGLFGRALHVIGFRLHERGGTQARIDALWRARRG